MLVNVLAPIDGLCLLATEHESIIKSTPLERSRVWFGCDVRWYDLEGDQLDLLLDARPRIAVDQVVIFAMEANAIELLSRVELFQSTRRDVEHEGKVLTKFCALSCTFMFILDKLHLVSCLTMHLPHLQLECSLADAGVRSEFWTYNTK